MSLVMLYVKLFCPLFRRLCWKLMRIKIRHLKRLDKAANAVDSCLNGCTDQYGPTYSAGIVFVFVLIMYRPASQAKLLVSNYPYINSFIALLFIALLFPPLLSSQVRTPPIHV